MKVLLKIGDCFSIPLEDASYAFGQYVYLDSVMGPLIRVFSLRSEGRDLAAECLRGAPLLFPPIFVGLNPPVRSGRWRRIGVLPVEDFTFPKFRSSTWLQPGIVTDWKIWDGESYEDAGVLPESLRSLEILVVHAYQDVEKRILTGRSWLAEGADFGVWNESA